MLYFRLPFSTEIFTTDELSSENPVSFYPFAHSEVINFKGKIKQISEEEFLNSEISSENLSLNLMDFKNENQEQYEEKLSEVIKFIDDNKLSKLVISRRKWLPFHNSSLNLSETFLNLCKAYENAFVYFFIKEDKCWIGAFSEILGKFNKKTSRFETMSLAGTLPLAETWTNKELSEQNTVTNFIEKILEKYSSVVSKSETQDHISGNIKHLKTNFSAQIKAENLENIISELHPTPAVCGIPTNFCKKAIEQFEIHPRKLYAGYIRVETDEYIQYFVNLRCAELFQNAAVIYVGGGITAGSSPQKEWEETELKAEAILKNLVFK